MQKSATSGIFFFRYAKHVKKDDFKEKDVNPELSSNKNTFNKNRTSMMSPIYTTR